MTGSIFYVYVHFRASDALPFYVGKGKGKRAYAVSGRADRWTKTYKKHGHSVRIVTGGLTEAQAFDLEKKYLADLRKRYPSHIVNITDGGDGASQVEVTGPKKQAIREFYARHGRMPSRRAKDPNEHALGRTCSDYVDEHSRSFDAEFREWYVDRSPLHQVRDRTAKAKTEVLDYIAEHGKLPPSTDKRYHAFYRYYSECSSVFDAGFAQQADKLLEGKRQKDSIAGRLALVVRILTQENRSPSQYAKDPEERTVAKWLGLYVKRHLDVKEQLKSLGYGRKGGRPRKRNCYLGVL